MASVLEELRAFIFTITDWLLLMAVFTIFFFTCNIAPVEVLGHTTLLPVPSEPSFAASLFSMMAEDIAPASVPLVVTSPLAAFAVQVKIALFLAFLFTSPVFLARLLSYLAPALYRHELRIVLILVTPLSLLFFFGMVFGYLFVVPPTFTALYSFTAPIGVTAFLDAGEFIGMTIALVCATGAAFTIPVFMALLSALGAVDARFWWGNARMALVCFLIVSAIITPDGSGVSMLILSLPVSLLYGGGAIICSGIERGRRGRQDQRAMINQ